DPALHGQFRYRAENHDTGQKVIFAGTPQQLIVPPRPANQGQQDAYDVLDRLVTHPSTARFLARKLCRYLLGEPVAQGVKDAVAAAYTATTGAIKARIRAARAPNAAADAPAKYKRPSHLMMSAIRAMSANVQATASLRQTHLTATGHLPFFWPTPD